MTLIDIISIIDENTTVYVQNTEEELVTSYDGRDSIDEAYNECEVIKIETLEDSILITIK